MKLIAVLIFVVAAGAKVDAASVVRKDVEDLFPLSIIHLNDFHAR